MAKPGRKRRRARRARQIEAEAAAVAMSQQAPESPGGQGEEVTRGELVITTQAIRSDWPLADKTRKAAIEWAEKALEGDDDRVAAAAARVLVAADRNNIAREKIEQAERHKKQPNLHAHVHQHRIVELPDDELLRIIAEGEGGKGTVEPP